MSERYDIYLHRKESIPVGTLWLSNIRGKVNSAFVYAEAWLRQQTKFPICPDLPLDQHAKTCDGLFSCFQDCSPDRWGRMLLQRQEASAASKENRRVRTLLESDYLLRVSDLSRQGALRISNDGGKTFLGHAAAGSIPPLVDLPVLLNAWKNIDGKPGTYDDLRTLVSPGSSLGGARPKASVLGSGGDLFIAKFPSRKDDRDIPLWEYVAFRLAKRAGLNTPCTELHRVLGKAVLLVKRFDRNGAGRVPFLSAMSMLQARDGEHMSYADMAAALQETGTAPREDLHELWSRMVFNMCIYNVDDHLRNHAFLHDGTGWRLSPVYDLEISHPAEKAPYLHTGIIDNDSGIDLQAAVEAAEFFRLSKAAALQRMKEIRDAVSHWRYEASSAGATKAEMQYMRDAFEYL